MLPAALAANKVAGPPERAASTLSRPASSRCSSRVFSRACLAWRSWDCFAPSSGFGVLNPVNSVFSVAIFDLNRAIASQKSVKLFRRNDPTGSQSKDRFQHRDTTHETTRNVSVLRSSVNRHFQHRGRAPIIRCLRRVLERHEIEIHIDAPGHWLDPHHPLVCHQPWFWKIDCNPYPAMTPPTRAKHLPRTEIV